MSSTSCEEPEAPELVVESDLVSAEDVVETILAELACEMIGYWPHQTPTPHQIYH